MTSWREFRLVRPKKTLIWKIRQVDEFYETQSGQLDGKMQTFSDRPGEKGKPNTKAYVSALDNCAWNIEREIRIKQEHGYIEYIDGKPSTDQQNSVDWSKPLPKNFSGFKPQTSIEPEALKKLHQADRIVYTRKYNGQCHYAVHHTDGWQIYSRRMDLVTEKFSKYIEQLQQTSFQVGTLLVGELVCFKWGTSLEDFRAISRFCRADKDEAQRLIEEQEISQPVFYLFDLLFHNGKDLQTTSYFDRRDLIVNAMDNLYDTENNEPKIDDLLITLVDCYHVTPETWQEFAQSRKWEGFVGIDTQSIPGDKFYTFTGKPERPKGHFKLKPTLTEEVVIFAGLEGTGKRLGRLGSVFIKQKYPACYPEIDILHPLAGQFFFAGKCGSGFKQEDLELIENLMQEKNLPLLKKEKEVEQLDLSTEDGLVVELEFESRMPKTHKFRFPVFTRIREDKSVKECEAQTLGLEEDEE